MRYSILHAAALFGACASALAQPPPRGLDQALVDTLALGNAAGCGTAFGLPDFRTAADPQLALDTYLAAERDAGRLGKELAAVCGSSAVASAAALGGSLGSPQSTKTVSQFRLARARVDSRLDSRGKRADFGSPVLLAQLGGGSPLTGAAAAVGDDASDGGPGLFSRLSHERRERVTTALEAGHKAAASEAQIGIDYAARGGWVAGAWLGYRSTDADYRGVKLLIGGADAGFGGSLGAVQAEICKVGPGGGFDDKGAQLGGFIAKRSGQAFADVGVQFSRRDYSYQRNVCAIEADSAAIVRDAGSPSGFSSGSTVAAGGIAIDDVYAGTVSGKARVSEWSLSGRIGFDGGGEQWQWGPRLSLTYQRTNIGAYTESGRTSVTHTVESVSKALRTSRAAGDPTGLELAFDRQSRTSLLSELQLVAAYRHETGLGTLVPRVSLSWQHEFKGEREPVTVRMAQDRRTSPTRLSFTTDSTDKSKGTVSLGLSLLRGPQFAADMELTRLLADDRFDSTQLALQARWRF